MSTTNYGNSTIVFGYKYPATASAFNKLIKDALPHGIYLGGTLSQIGNQVIIAHYSAVFNSGSLTSNKISTAIAINMNSDVGQGDITPSAPYIVANYTYANVIINYPDYYFKAEEDLSSTDIIFGKGVFSGATLTGFDYTVATIAPQYNPTTNTFNINCDTFIKNNRINKEVLTAIDVDTTTTELLGNTSFFCSPTADRTLDITAGASFEDTEVYVYNNSSTYKVTVTYFTATTFDILANEYVKFKWNGTHWIIIESNSQEFLGWEECFYSLSRTAEIDATNHIYELTVTGDKTAYFKAGQKIKFTQDASIKYAIITYVETSGGNTILTVYGGTDYAISANAITNVRLAKVNRPYDFNCNEEKWTISVDFSAYTKTSPVANTLYNTGNTFYGEKGSWKYKGRLGGICSHSGGTGFVSIKASESSSSSVNSILLFANKGYASWGNVSDYIDNKTLLTRTPHYFLISYDASGANSISFLGTSADFTGLKITPCGI